MEASVIAEILNPQVLLFIAGGVLIGIGFGSIPGLNTPMALAVVLPLTYGMNTVAAISTLLAVYVGGISGGLISAILLRMPGTAAAVVTTFDGYPMAQKGHAMRALGLGVISSFIGGMFSAIVLIFLTPVLARVALRFGPWEFFGAVALSLSMVSTLVRGDLVKGFIACSIGLIVAMVGADPISGTIRLSFGQYQLSGGVRIVVMIIGIFALSEVFSSSGKSLKPVKRSEANMGYRDFFRVFRELRGQAANLLRSSVIGTAIGILPGLAGSTASLMAYTAARRFVKNPEQFGEGHPSGIVAPESANNAVSGGAMIPMLALGVPGSSPVALIMGAFLVHGVTIGPLLLSETPELIQSIFMALVVANILMLLLQSGLLRMYARVILVAKAILLPILVVFCVVGAFVANNSMFDVGLLIGFGTLAYILERNGFHLAPMVMGYVLGGYVELYFRRTVIYYDSIANAFLTPSLGTVLVSIAALVPIVNLVNRIPAVKRWRAERKRERVERRADNAKR
jgi:putative tricarboxylic transport membrane protein